jgi:hypothetical protein
VRRIGVVPHNVNPLTFLAVHLSNDVTKIVTETHTTPNDVTKIVTTTATFGSPPVFFVTTTATFGSTPGTTGLFYWRNEMRYGTYTCSLVSRGIEYGFTFGQAAYEGDDNTAGPCEIGDSEFDVVLGVTYTNDTAKIEAQWSKYAWVAKAIIEAHKFATRKGYVDFDAVEHDDDGEPYDYKSRRG